MRAKRKLREIIVDEIIVFSLILSCMALGLSLLGEANGFHIKRVEEWLTLACTLLVSVFWWRARGWFRRKMEPVDFVVLVGQIMPLGTGILAIVKDNFGLAVVGAGLAVIVLIVAHIPQFGLTRRGDFARMQAITSRRRSDGITLRG